MAKIFKVLAYVVDPVDEFDEWGLAGCLNYCTKHDDISLRCLKIDSIDIGKWDDNLPVNRLDCGIEEFEKYFVRGIIMDKCNFYPKVSNKAMEETNVKKEKNK